MIRAGHVAARYQGGNVANSRTRPLKEVLRKHVWVLYTGDSLTRVAMLLSFLTEYIFIG